MEDRSKAGPGRRAGSDSTTDPDREGTPNRFPGEGISPARNTQEGKPGLDRGATPGAHGDRPPHQDIKPGTRRDLEQADLGQTDAEPDADD